MRLVKYFLLAFLLTCSTAGLFADNGRQYSIDQVAAQLKRSTGGEILSAEVQQDKKGTVYRFKIKNEGRVRVVVMRPDGTRVR